MKTKNKPRVFITLHPRGKNSLGEARLRLGHAAFHWAILISPKSSQLIETQLPPTHYAYDVTDNIDLDPVTGLDRNPDRNWRFRARTYPAADSDGRGDVSADPALALGILSQVLVGKVPGGVSLDRIQSGLEGIVLPRTGVDGENCVSWTREAIGVLKRLGVVEEGELEVGRFMDEALGFADECLREKREMGTAWNYTGRRV